MSDKVKVRVKFRGREMMDQELGDESMDKLLKVSVTWVK